MPTAAPPATPATPAADRLAYVTAYGWAWVSQVRAAGLDPKRIAYVRWLILKGIITDA